jgi:hypothetical protein
MWLSHAVYTLNEDLGLLAPLAVVAVLHMLLWEILALQVDL